MLRSCARQSTSRKTSPLRSGLRGIIPISLLSIRRYPRPAGASRHQGGAARQAIQARAEDGPNWALHCSMTERPPTTHARRRKLAEMLLHALRHLGSVFTGTVSIGHRLRHVRFAGRLYVRRAGAHFELGKDYYPVRRREHNCWANAPDSAIASRRVRLRVVKVDMESTRSISCWMKSSKSPDRKKPLAIRRRRLQRTGGKGKKTSWLFAPDYGFHAVTSRTRRIPTGTRNLLARATQRPAHARLIKLAEQTAYALSP